LGHYVRIARICSEINSRRGIKCDVIAGGVPFEELPEWSKSDVFWLKNLNYWGDKVKDKYTEDADSLRNKFEIRRRQISKYLKNKRYDYLITEYFPFSKFQLKQEVEFLIDIIKKSNPNCKVVSSVRDLVHSGALPYSKEILKILNIHFDGILVHSDPRVVSLEYSFPAINNFKGKLIYTGFVTNTHLVRQSKRKFDIVISVGGGRDGFHLINFILEILEKNWKTYLNYNFSMFLGKFFPYEKIKLSKIRGLPNIKIGEFGKFYDSICNCSFLISQAGYNTFYEAASLGVPMLLFPRKRFEQLERAKLAEKFNFGKILKRAEDLENFIIDYNTLDGYFLDWNFEGAKNVVDYLMEGL